MARSLNPRTRLGLLFNTTTSEVLVRLYGPKGIIKERVSEIRVAP